MLHELHRRYDRMREPWRYLVALAVIGTLALGISQPWCASLAVGAIAAIGVLLGSRIRYLEGRQP